MSDEQKVPTFVRILISVANPPQNTVTLHGGARLTRLGAPTDGDHLFQLMTTSR
jgi:hypothetical protein